MENKDVLSGVGLPGVVLSPTPGKQELTLPTKKGKSKVWKIFAGIAAVFLVAGVAFGSYYFTANLNQAQTPNSPDDASADGGRVRSARDIGNPAKRNEALKREEEVKKAKAAAAADAVKGDHKLLLDEAKKAIDAGKQVPGGVNYTADMMATLREYAVKKYGGSATADAVFGIGRTGDECNGPQCSNDDGLVKDPDNKTIQNYSGFYAVNTYGADGKVTGVAYRPIASPLKEKDSGGGKTTASCKVTTWTPATNTVCEGVEFTQTSNCKTTRKATGTKDCSCVVSSWTPATNTVCEGEDFTQTSNCDTTREAVGTKVCETGTPDLSSTKLAYKNESSNSSGKYSLRTEIDKVSKDQVFVYAFEIKNDGDGKADKIVLKDVLKGDNQEWLSYVDGESRCKYSSSSRTVTCSGMTLEAGENDTYKFRVKVSGSATNGETIKNIGVISYDGMPNGGEAEASLELTVSSVVGCNKACTSDEECSTGLTCDTDSNTCRRPACTDATSCVCVTERVVEEEPVERVIVVTQAPRRVVVTAAPTVLPETGILDFPGAAAFGGGLILAVVGILLAL